MITRRDALKNLAMATGALTIATATSSHGQTTSPSTPAPDSEGVFKLPPLGYDYDALEPFIDAETMKLHHTKHHAAYVSKLNEAITKAPELSKKSVEDLIKDLNAVPEAIRTAVRNQGGGHANHSLFWKTLQKNENGKPSGDLAKAIDKAWGNFGKFQEEFSGAAMKVFGSGWAWLLWKNGKLAIDTSANQDSPLSTGAFPLLGVDVWEHAYYLKYQNRRADYLKAFQNVINWNFVAERFANAGN